MAERPDYAVALLAAGQSRRFGADDKLAASFRGGLLGERACQTLAALDLPQRWVIAAQADHPCAHAWQAAGFTIAVNPMATSGIGSSVALAARLALEAGTDGLLLALADMPLVTLDHCRAVMVRAVEIGPSAIVASVAQGVRSPPAAFGREHLASLATLTGDVGARALLQSARLVTCAPDQLIDIDDAQALERAITMTNRGNRG